ncbi:hypothetical protein PV05_01192 [Exophiala xenobiotica]|uniref:DUF7923 domain-containing protein n=1 Tax=Exophiala xenobiotica TaxID=348802 RepID=A0A0D2F291_9EURO|nr:uncharacterized protein PV05_01192 [Exophiala xenobiotica]KIW61025.1 hypothetical protein PV05_01192 [Exophiala xenobiotica]
MPFSSWFFPPRPKLEVPDGDNDGGSDRPASRSAIDDMDFEAIADKVENLQLELAYAYDLCEQANLQFDKYRVQLQDLKQDLGTERASNAILKDMLSQERKNSAMLKAQFNFANQEVKRQRVLASQLQARLNTETASLNAMTKHARAVENRFVETQFDLEYLKCTTDAEKLSQAPTIQSKDSPIPAQPFVVVLVDGDAYLWSHDIFLNENRMLGGTRIEPGGLAATRIKNEVTKYIMEQAPSIPVTSKVITRVFCNFGTSERRMLSRQRVRSTAVGLREFAIQFTERVPLFDYFDAGRGKERADDKIRENFHLFLSTPNCHAVFVAACTDNGFARMLEQYADHPFANQKIILVSPGYTALEFERFHFKHVEWPTVFAVKTMPRETAIKRDKVLQKQRVQKIFALRGLTLGVPQIETEVDYHDLVMNMLPKWNMNDAKINVSEDVEVRMKQGVGSDAEWKSSGISPGLPGDEDVD